MKTVIRFATVMLLFCSSSIVWAENNVKPETKEKKEVKQTLNAKEKEEEPIAMECVVTSCNGVECDPRFADVSVACDYVIANDICYDKD